MTAFTGRRWLIEQLEEFLSENDRGHVIVEAAAGVGKTALAAALVTANKWPCHFTRNAGGRGSRAALANLAAQLIPECELADEWAPNDVFAAEAVAPGWFEALLQAASATLDGRSLVIVVDGLDEAEHVDGALPLGLPRTLPPNVYLVITCRTGTDYLVPTGPHLVLPIESSSEDNLNDMREFLGARAATEPLASHLYEARTPAKDYAALLVERCNGIWVYLRYVLDEIEHGRRQVDDLRTLPRSLVGYYLEKLDGERQRPEWAWLYRPLLATLAVAGEALPLHRLTALAGLPEAEAEEVRRFCDGSWLPFLTVRRSSRPARYGIYHASLRDFLTGATAADEAGDRAARAADDLAESAAQAHRRYVALLSAEVPTLPDGRRDWAAADGYTVRHLVAHAAAAARDVFDPQARATAAAVLDELLGDLECVLHAEPYSLSEALGKPRHEGAERVARVYRISYGLHRQLDVLARRRVFAMDAARLGDAGLARRASSADPDGWHPRWATGAGPLGALRLTIDTADSKIRSLRCTRVGASPAAVCITGDVGLGVVQVWNLTTGEQIGSFEAGTLAEIAGCVEVDGKAVTAVASMRMLHMWNVATNEVALLVAEGSDAAPTAVTTMMVDGAPVAIAALDQDDLYVWDLTDPRGPGRLLGRHPGATHWPNEVTSLHGSRAGGRPVVAAVGAGHGSVWDLRAGAKLHDGFTYPVDSPSIDGAPATVLDAGTGSVVLVSAQSRMMAFDVSTGAPSDLFVAGDPSGNFAVTEVSGVPYLFAVDDVDGLTAWNLAEHGSLPNRLPLEFQVRSLDCTTVDGRPLLAVAGQTRIAGHREFTTQIKLFDAASIVAAATEPQSPAIFSATQVTTAGGERILAGSTDGSLHLFESGTGIRKPLSTGDSHGRVYPVLATGDTAIAAVLDGPLQRWSLETARTVGAPFTAHPGRVFAMTTLVDDGRTTVVTGQDCAELHFWDPTTGEESGPPLTHRHGSGGVNALISFELAGATVLATGGANDSTIRLWRPGGDGMRLDRAVEAHWLMVGALAAVTVDGQPMLVSGGGLDGQVSAWNPLSGARVWGPVTTNRMGVQAIVPARFRGTPALLTGGFYSTEVGVWSMLTGARLGALTMPSPVNGVLFGLDAVLVVQSGQDLIALTPPPFLQPGS